MKYVDVRLRDGFAVRELAQVLPSREMALLIADSPDTRFSSDVVTIARPDMFQSRRVKRVLAEAHEHRRLHHLGRHGFVDIVGGKCYWRVHQGKGAMMREYGVISRFVRPNGHHVVSLSGLGSVGTWAAAKACTDIHLLDAIEGLLAPEFEAAAAAGRDPQNVPFEVLVEVTYETDDQPRDYLAQFGEEVIAGLITGRSGPPANYEGPAGPGYSEDELMIKPILAAVGPAQPNPWHVVVALTKNDCPANAATAPEAIDRFVVDGVEFSDNVTSQFNMCLHAWYEGPKSGAQLNAGDLWGKPGSRSVPNANSIRPQANKAASQLGVSGDLIHCTQCGTNWFYHLNSVSQAVHETWEHVGFPDLQGPPPGLAQVQQEP